MSNIAENYIFKDCRDQALIKHPHSLNDQVFNLEKLINCDVYILDTTESIYADNCTNCRFFIAPVRGSFFIRDSNDCTCSVACKQLRVKNCNNITFFLYSVSDPHIEASFDMRFAPYNFSYPNQQLDFQKVGFDVKENRWCKVYDHSSGAGTGHFSLLPPNQFKKSEKRLDGHPPPINPVPIPQQYGGDLKQEIVPGSRPEPVPKPEQRPEPGLRPQQRLDPAERRDDMVNIDLQSEKDFQGSITVDYQRGTGFDINNEGIPAIFEFNELRQNLNRFSEIHAEHYPQWSEIIFAIYLAVVGFFVVLLMMSLLKMSSEWKLEATGVFLFIVIASLLSLLGFLIVKMKRVQSVWMGQITEAENSQNSEYFEGKGSKISVSFTRVTISLGIN